MRLQASWSSKNKEDFSIYSLAGWHCPIQFTSKSYNTTTHETHGLNNYYPSLASMHFNRSNQSALQKTESPHPNPASNSFNSTHTNSFIHTRTPYRCIQNIRTLDWLIGDHHADFKQINDIRCKKLRETLIITVGLNDSFPYSAEQCVIKFQSSSLFLIWLKSMQPSELKSTLH